MSRENDNTGEDPVVPSSGPAARSGDEELDTPSLGRFYDEAEKELGPEALHFDVVKRALDLWEQDVKGHERPHHPPPGKDAQ